MGEPTALKVLQRCYEYKRSAREARPGTAVGPQGLVAGGWAPGFSGCICYHLLCPLCGARSLRNPFFAGPFWIPAVLLSYSSSEYLFCWYRRGCVPGTYFVVRNSITRVASFERSSIPREFNTQGEKLDNLQSWS